MPKLRDRVGPDLRVLFVGINPGIRTALTGHHFAGYSNRFWKLLYESGLVPEPVSAEDDVRLPEWGYGVTNLIPRESTGIDVLEPWEYRQGRVRLLRKIARWRPKIVALVGVTLYRAVFPPAPRGGVEPSEVAAAVTSAATRPRIGLQAETLHGAAVFVLPNPSGRNANFSYGEMLAAFRALRRYLDEHGLSGPVSGPEWRRTDAG